MLRRSTAYSTYEYGDSGDHDDCQQSSTRKPEALVRAVGRNVRPHPGELATVEQQCGVGHIGPETIRLEAPACADVAQHEGYRRHDCEREHGTHDRFAHMIPSA